MKPLYLDGGQVNSIRLEFGSLRVTSLDLANTWFPLERVSRVIIYGQLTLSTRVIFACLKRNIPIVFSSSEDGYVGVCMGTGYQAQALPSHMQEIYELPDQLYLLDNWFFAQERFKILRLQKKFRLDNTEFEAAEIQLQLETRICMNYQYYHWGYSLKQLRPMIAAQQTMLLQYFGFKSETLRPAPASKGLLHHFIKLIEWEVWELAANGHLPKNSAKKQLVRYFQTHAPHLERQTRIQIDRLWHRFYEIEHESK